MDILYRVLKGNISLIYFVYGLAFFMLGFTVLLKNRSDSKFKMANSLIYLAIFGILHGFYEWGYIFIPMQQNHCSLVVFRELYTIRIFIGASSYAFLFYFGVHLLVKTKQKWNFLLAVPWIILMIWVIFGGYFRFIVGITNFHKWLNSGDTVSRYLLAVPGVIFVSYALFLQKEELKLLENKSIIKDLYGFIVFIILYGIAAGLVVPPDKHLMAQYINTNIFFDIVKLPVQVFRTLAGIGMNYCVVGILDMYHLQHQKKLEIVRKEKTILDERQRIYRNLHDGIVQSIYGVGLGLENISFLIEEDPEKAKAEIKGNLNKLNEVIVDLRDYIMGLKPQISRVKTLYQLLKELIDEFNAPGIRVEFDYEISKSLEFSPARLDNLYHILQEGLNNIKKHSKAENISLKVSNGECIIITLEDDGIGFAEKEINNLNKKGHYGLSNMMERVKLLNGDLDINSVKGEGTEIIIKIPYEEGQ
jgi:signal transduction histidine kinase